MKKILQSTLSILLATLLSTSVFTAFADSTWHNEVDLKIEEAVLNREKNYDNYIAAYADVAQGEKEIVVSASNFYEIASDSSATLHEEFNGKTNKIGGNRQVGRGQRKGSSNSDGSNRKTVW